MLCSIIQTSSSESVLLSLVSKYSAITTMSYSDGPVNKAIEYERSDKVVWALLEANKNEAKAFQ